MNSPVMAAISDKCEKLLGQTAIFENITPLKYEHHVNKTKNVLTKREGQVKMVFRHRDLCAKILQ
jgi:hypothetical protein